VAFDHALGDGTVPSPVFARYELGGVPGGGFLEAIAEGPSPRCINVYEAAMRACHAEHLTCVLDERPPRTVVAGDHMMVDDNVSVRKHSLVLLCDYV
jgi:hypothetical protein